MTTTKDPSPTTPGIWAVTKITFANVDDVLADQRRMLENAPGFDPSAPVECVFVEATDDLLPEMPAGASNGNVVVAFLGNGPRAAANAALIASVPDLRAALDACRPVIERCESGLLDDEGDAYRAIFANGGHRLIDDAVAALAKLGGAK